MGINPKRIRTLNTLKASTGPIIYWMNRDMRLNDNWALLHAQNLSIEQNQPLIIIYNLVTDFLGGESRQLNFKIEALKQLEQDSRKKNIPFIFLSSKQSDSSSLLQNFLKKYKPGTLITDFCPLKICDTWINKIKKELTVKFIQVDAHNIVPCFHASQKQEFAAYTFRPKIHKQLPEFLENFPALKKQSQSLVDKLPAGVKKQQNDFKKIDKSVNPRNSKKQTAIQFVTWLKPGEKAAAKTLTDFLENKLNKYDTQRNDPNHNALSNLSPYLHYGMISAQRVALEAQKYDKNISAQEAFLEELIVRRELSDNYCHYNKNYDNPKGFPDWAKKTLNEHAHDPREYIYTKKQLEEAKTHDDLWNAAQLQMVKTGKMHGYMRMYWAKKILEWTGTPTHAQKIAIYLNDKYEIDGRDPNGYTGIAWSIGGVHDRAWGERDIFGKIRYMSFNGAKSKFNVKKFIQTWIID